MADLDYDELFAQLGPDEGKGNEPPHPGEREEFNVEGATPNPDEAGKTEGAKDAPPTPQYVKKEDYDSLQTQLAEMRGTLTALSQQRREPVQEYQAPAPPPQNQQAAEAAVRARLKKIGEGLILGDETALAELLEIGANISQAQNAQMAAPALTAVTDLVIEGFLSKKSNDKFYDKISERFEAELSRANKAAFNGASREQIRGVCEALWKAAKADVFDEVLAEGEKKRAAAARQTAPNYHGGPSSTGNGKTKAQVSEEWVKFAERAGIPADQISGMFAEMDE